MKSLCMHAPSPMDAQTPHVPGCSLPLPPGLWQVLHINDAVWATTGGVGRAHRTFQKTDERKVADDFAYVPKLDCDDPVNKQTDGTPVPDCDSGTCRDRQGNSNCPPSADPIGVRSTHYFNAGIAVAEAGTIVRTMDGGYTWDCIRGPGAACSSQAGLPELNAVSVNVRLGGFGYDNTYYAEDTTSEVDGSDWTLLYASNEGGDKKPATGLDGVWWPDSFETYMEGFAVGRSGSIVRIENAGINRWDPFDLNDNRDDPKDLVEVDPQNADGSGCQTKKSINDVFFWNMHLAFFVGDQGYICRYGFDIQTEESTRGPGTWISDVLDGTIALKWDLQGADEQGLQWGKIVDNKDYMYSDLKSIFCLQYDDLQAESWSNTQMDATQGITYSQHVTCFAVGTHPGRPGTTSAILRYSSQAVQISTDPTQPEFREEAAWQPQNSGTDEVLNDVYCVKTKDKYGKFVASDNLFCYAVGNNGEIRFTSNGGASPWRSRFSGVQENLRKVVIIGVTPGDAANENDGGGEQAVAVGDNGRVIRTNDGGITWEKLERVTPEHLVAVQFNAFDDYSYANAVDSEYLSDDSLLFEGDNNYLLPFGNGVATGVVLFNWMQKTGACGVGSPNSGTATNRFYDCKKPEVSVVLRTNCQSTLTSTHWRCAAECVDKTATVPVALDSTLVSAEMWTEYFGNQVSQEASGTSLYARLSACDEVWTIGHGQQWHEDTRETRAYQSVVVDDTLLEVQESEDVKAIRPAHELCMYGWPRHLYRMEEGNRRKAISNVSSIARQQSEFTFLGRLRYSKANCTLMGGRFYDAETHYLPDCVFEFGELRKCPSWEVHGMGHTADSFNAPKATKIPFVNFSVITDPCNDGWFGVTCEDFASSDAMPGAIDNKTVTQIWLYSNNLQGEVPTLIRDLVSIRSLSLGSNRLIGAIPSKVWANMSHLKYLSLAENSLTGAIPDALGDLATLEELRLHGNQLTGNIPSEFGRLQALQSLSFHANSLFGTVPSELGDLSSLQYLWMSSNNLTGALPSELGRLDHLRYLWFANNSITSLPEEIGHLSSLRSLDGSNNSVADRLPYTIGQLRNLRVLKFGHNRIRATLPDALGSCTSLVLLELQHNQLVGPVPASFGLLQELTSLDLSHNLLERELPVSIEGMRSLQVLQLQNNNLEGGLPPSIGTLRRLQKLNIASNRLSLPLPDELADCDQLEMIDLQSNEITGPLPSGIWRLQMLEYLYMTNNQLVGPVPEGIGFLGQIRELRLEANRIDGTLPPTIGDAATLEVIRADKNQLSGSLPSTIGKLRNVLNLDLHDNKLVGTIPPAISGMESVVRLYLQQNQLEGQIPVTLGDSPGQNDSSVPLASLQELKLSSNKISGTIPPSLGKLYSLHHLAIDSNQITGSIPDELGFLSQRLQLLHLQNNRLDGLLPTFFRQADFRAVAINLAANPFWCPLPAWPALNGTASCVHCPNDLYLEDDHRTCSDHGVCINGRSCRCDPMWEGETCDLLRCPNECNQHGDCINEKQPEMCVLSNIDEESEANASTRVEVTEGMCTELSDSCVQAYHDCPDKGISIQVDSTGIVIAVEARHNQIVFARCICKDAWSGNDCTMPPLPPPTVEPWPDPYAGFDFSVEESPGSRRAVSRSATQTGASIGLAVMTAVGIARRP